MKKVNNLKKVMAILSSGYVLVGGAYQVKMNNIDRSIDRLDDIKVHSFEIDSEHPNLENAYTHFVSSIEQIPSIKERVKVGDLEYHSSTSSSFSNDSIDYIISDDSIRIKIKDSKNKYSSLFYYVYNNDGSYSISCEYDKDVEKLLDRIKNSNNGKFDFNYLDRYHFYSIIYNFSKDGVLTDSIVSESSRRNAKFEYINGDINKYKFYVNKKLFIDNSENDIIVYDNDSSFNKDDFGKYNDIIPKIDYRFDFSIHNIEYYFDENYKFNGLFAENSYGEYLKIDNSYSLEYKNLDHHDMDNNTYYNYIYSDNKSLEIKKEKLQDDKKIICDEQYDTNGNLISSKKGDITIFKKDGNKDIYYTDEGIVEHIDEKKDDTIITHTYSDGVIHKSECEDYVILYQDGVVKSVDASKDGCEISVNGSVYKLNRSDSLSFENGVLKSKKLGTEEWHYYDGINVSSYYNSYSNVRINYDDKGNIDGCSYNYLNEKYKKIYDVESAFDYFMSNIDDKHKIDIQFSNDDFYVNFSNNNVVTLSYSDIRFTFINDRLYNFEYYGSDKKTPFEWYDIHVFDGNVHNLPQDVIQYKGKTFDDKEFSYSTLDGILHESDLSTSNKKL